MRPFFIRLVSREISGLRSVDGESDNAAKMSARLVTDLDPGMRSEEFTGFLPRYGAAQSVPSELFPPELAMVGAYRCTPLASFLEKLLG